MRLIREAATFVAEYMLNEDALFSATVRDEIYNSEYVVFGYSVTNAGVSYEEPIFTNGLEEEYYNDCNEIFLVSELYDDMPEIKELMYKMLNDANNDTLDDIEIEDGKNYDECRGY